MDTTKWTNTPLTLYKVFHPSFNWLDERELLSFEVLHHKHSITYRPKQKVTTIQPVFFFLSRALAVAYVSKWRVQSYNFAADAQIWQCHAAYVYAPPRYVPASSDVEMFDLFWHAYYRCTDTDDLRGLFAGLKSVPRGTVMAFTFSIESPVCTPQHSDDGTAQ